MSRPVETVRVELGDRAYDVQIGEGLIETAGARILPLLTQRRVAIVTDANVAEVHLEPFRAALEAAGIRSTALVLPAGEATKGWSEFSRCVEWLLAEQVERRDVVVALGGGVIGDLVGFAAAVLRRGVRFVQVPTTLLAQVDSSVGGKTGINTPQGKNLVGAFHQPSLVLADTGVLSTLPERDFLAGYGEVVKYGLMGDAAFFDWLEANGPAMAAGDGAARIRAVTRSVEMKAGIVARDETEQGERALLNLGHTFCHAPEAATGYSDRLLHGGGVRLRAGLRTVRPAGPVFAGGSGAGPRPSGGHGHEARPVRDPRRPARRGHADRADGAGQEGAGRQAALRPGPRHRRGLRHRCGPARGAAGRAGRCPVLQPRAGLRRASTQTVFTHRASFASIAAMRASAWGWLRNQAGITAGPPPVSAPSLRNRLFCGAVPIPDLISRAVA